MRHQTFFAVERADRLKQQHVAFFKFFAPEAREILDDLLEKYARDGELQFTLPDVLKVRPISDQGNVNKMSANSAAQTISATPSTTPIATVCALKHLKTL